MGPFASRLVVMARRRMASRHVACCWLLPASCPFQRSPSGMAPREIGLVRESFNNPYVKEPNMKRLLKKRPVTRNRLLRVDLLEPRNMLSVSMPLSPAPVYPAVSTPAAALMAPRVDLTALTTGQGNNQRAFAQSSLNAAVAPALVVGSPNGGETWQAGSTYTVNWSISGSTSTLNYQYMALSTDGGATYNNISSPLSASARSFSFMPGSGQVTTSAMIRVRAMDANGYIRAVDTSNGTFTIRNSVVAGDSYEVDDSAGEARTIATDGSTQTHSLHVGSDVDWVKFTLPQRSSVVLETNGPAGDTEMWLYGPNSSTSFVEYDDDDGNGTFSRIDRSGGNALGAGTYFVRIAEYGSNNAVASYTISVRATPAVIGDQYEPDNTAGQATTISSMGSPQRHSINPAGDVDWVKFTLNQTSPVVLETRGVSGGDTQVWLYGPNSSTTLVAYDDDHGIGYYSRIVSAALTPGTYYARVTAFGANQVISQYTISATALQPADVFLTRDPSSLISTTIRTAESLELGVSYSATYSHAAMYVGNGIVAEMTGSGYRETSLAAWYSNNEYADIYRNVHIGNLGPLVAAVARSYSGTNYASWQIEVLGVTALSPRVVGPIITSQAYVSYLAQDAGPRRMICSELVARAFAAVGNAATLRVTLWPTLDLIGDLSDNFRWDFTTPTVLSRSPDLTCINPDFGAP